MSTLGSTSRGGSQHILRPSVSADPERKSKQDVGVLFVAFFFSPPPPSSLPPVLRPLGLQCQDGGDAGGEGTLTGFISDTLRIPSNLQQI